MTQELSIRNNRVITKVPKKVYRIKSTLIGKSRIYTVNKVDKLEVSDYALEHICRGQELKEMKLLQDSDALLNKISRVNLHDRDYGKVKQYLHLKHGISRSLANTNGEIVNELNVIV